MNYVTFLPARGVGTAVPEPSWKASAGLEAHAANNVINNNSQYMITSYYGHHYTQVHR